jgi:hypothetical protein
VSQVPCDHIIENVCARMPEVYVVLNCRSADEHLYLTRAQTDERFLLLGERVKNDESARQREMRRQLQHGY